LPGPFSRQPVRAPLPYPLLCPLKMMIFAPFLLMLRTMPIFTPQKRICPPFFYPPPYRLTKWTSFFLPPFLGSFDPPQHRERNSCRSENSLPFSLSLKYFIISLLKPHPLLFGHSGPARGYHLFVILVFLRQFVTHFFFSLFAAFFFLPRKKWCCFFPWEGSTPYYLSVQSFARLKDPPTAFFFLQEDPHQ